MFNGYLNWSKVIWVGQRSIGLNGIHFDTFEAVIHKKKKNIKAIICKSPKLKGSNSQLILNLYY